MIPFMFATGIENSYPTLEHGRVRRDQMEECGHYRNWKADFGLVARMGINYLRYGVPLHRVWLGPGRYDWEFSDQAFGELRRLGIEAIADLCHFGVPDWVGNFQNPDFPDLFRTYAADFAARYPWIRFYTPVNEMYVCARFSALYGWWNEQQASPRAYVTAVKHLARANLLAMHEVRQRRADAIFIQSESTEYFHPCEPASVELVDAINQIRFLTLDLNYGHPLDPATRTFVQECGMTQEECRFFEQNAVRRNCVLGTDYYVTNEHYVMPDGERHAAGELLGYTTIARQYYERYGLPLMHTETNRDEGPHGDEAAIWLRRQWSQMLGLMHAGVPMVGFTWYSLTDQVDWNDSLRFIEGRVNARGLFDLDRQIRDAGREYGKLIGDWKDRLRAYNDLEPDPRMAVDHRPDAGAVTDNLRRLLMKMDTHDTDKPQ
ncbi:family 1 glycosylhydrolase [uncultured Massilia sp.]|uniref:family 1 glycosylhydrolase n=1 Tax=uncultured Massilia sp. TaxID=169973 RepID=UPI0025E414E1|nr:family 1 glycosylhydrolase [uncultured Massilia sp.]